MEKRRGLKVFIVLIAIAAALFIIFAFISVKTNVNIITGAISTIKNIVSGSFSEAIAKMQQGLSNIYKIALIELAVLIAAIVMALIATWYLIKAYSSAVKLSLIDELTGIYNRRALNKILDIEIKRAERFKHPLTILMMDIDFFKIYNDKNGHVAGDELLQRVSRLIGSKIRDTDTLGRYGGEEFLVILPETSHNGAAKVAEKIRRTIAETRFKGQETQPKGRVTISLGLATFHGEYEQGKHLIHSADQLLYKAKEAGRNMLMKAYYKDSVLVKQ